MKKTLTIILALILFAPKSLQAQKGDTAAAIAGGLAAIGAGIAAIEQLKEQLEQKAVEQVSTLGLHTTPSGAAGFAACLLDDAPSPLVIVSEGAL